MSTVNVNKIAERTGSNPINVRDIASKVLLAAAEGSMSIGHGEGTVKTALDQIDSTLDQFDQNFDQVDIDLAAINTNMGKEKAQRIPTVFDFGAVGNGIVDDTAAIQTAINSTTGALSLGQKNAVFKVSRLNGRSNLDLCGRGELDFSGNGDYANTIADPLFKFFGTAGPARLLTANAVPGSSTLTVTDTSGISVGDIIEVGTPGYNGDFVDTSVAVQSAETRQVLQVISPTQIQLVEPICDEIGYSVANGGQVRLLSTMNNITIQNTVTIRGKGRPASGAGDNGIIIMYGRDVKIHCQFKRVDLAAVRFEGCYNYEASWCRITHDAQGANTGVNYGIVPSGSSSYGRIHHNFLANMRHGIVTSHLSASLGLGVLGAVRELDIYQNYVLNTWHAGIATHNDADRVRIYENVILGCAQGINPRERNIEVCRNTIRRCAQGVVISAHPRNLLIAENTFEDLSGSAVLGTWDGVRDATDIVIRANKATRLNGGITLTLAAPITGNASIYIDENVITKVTGAGGAQAVIRILGASFTKGGICNNKITDATNAAGISVSNGATDLVFLGNIVRGVSGNSYVTQGSMTSVYAKGNFGANWSGNTALTNSSSVLTDNTFYA